MTNMIQVCSKFHSVRVSITNARPDEIARQRSRAIRRKNGKAIAVGLGPSRFAKLPTCTFHLYKKNRDGALNKRLTTSATFLEPRSWQFVESEAATLYQHTSTHFDPIYIRRG